MIEVTGVIRAWVGTGVRVALAAGFVACAVTAHGDGREMVRFDFETGDLQGWRVVDGGFGNFLCDRPVFHHTGEKYNKQGTYFLSTLENKDNKPDDQFTGVVESPVFVLAGPDLSFLVGGGGHDDTYVALCTESGGEVLKAGGKDAQRMERVQWQAPELVGQRVFLRIVDRNTGGWGHVTFDNFRANGVIDAKATRKHFKKAKSLVQTQDFEGKLKEVNVASLRLAIEDLTATNPVTYARGPAYIEQLDKLEDRLAELRNGVTEANEAWFKRNEKLIDAVHELRAEALTANPLVSGPPILFVARRQYKPDHHNTATLFQTGEINTASFEGGGALETVDFGKGGRVTTLLEAPDGMIRDPDVHYDGTRILFSMRRNIEDDYHVYEISADGSGLRQLTSAPGVSDIDPVYLPDGGIVFSSTREPKYCMCNRHIMANLFRMDGDGANIRQIGKSTLFEGHASVTPDGRVLYDRWEYVDRNFGDAQGLWTANPDGTGHAVYWGNNTWSPGGVIDARVIPGTHRAICTFTSCHDRPWGALAIVDRRLGLDNRAPVVQVWPANSIDLVSDGSPRKPNEYGFDLHLQVKPKYEDPYPLNDKYFLCARAVGRGEEMGICLLDVFGNELLIHTDKRGCFDPMPLAPRPRPPATPPKENLEDNVGYVYVADVYEGGPMKGVERGVVKYLRVVESPEKRFWNQPPWNGQGQMAPAMNWHDFNNKRILGTAPVEEDGSAYFTVPADTFVYFQLLDENGMMIQSMRSGTTVRPGERVGCVGCHEDRRSAPPPVYDKMPLALDRAPASLEGWHGPPRLFNYMAEVQPVFDAHCVRCHDYGKPGAKKLNLAGDRTNTFNTSYNELWRKRYVHAIGAGPAKTQPAYSWGSHASKVVEVVRKGHQKVELDPESFDRLVTWIDINAPYYPVYASAYPDNLTGRSPLNLQQLDELAKLTGVSFKDLADHARNQGPQVSFDRPESSPALAKLEDKAGPDYRRALEIIREGKQALEQRPRADMAGFAIHGVDAKHEDKYRQRQQVEARNLAAVRMNAKAFDDGVAASAERTP